MAAHPRLRIRYNPQKSYPGSQERTTVGAPRPASDAAPSAIEFVRSNTASYLQSLSLGAPPVYNLPITVDNQVNGVLIAKVAFNKANEFPGAAQTNSIAWPDAFGAAFTLHQSYIVDDVRIEIWHLVNPVETVDGNVRFAFSVQSTGSAPIAMGVEYYRNVDQVTPLTTAVTGTGTTTAVISVPTTTDQMPTDVIGVATDQTLSSGADQPQYWQNAQTANGGVDAESITGGGSAQLGADGSVMSWQWHPGGARRWCMIGCAINPAEGIARLTNAARDSKLVNVANGNTITLAGFQIAGASRHLLLKVGINQTDDDPANAAEVTGITWGANPLAVVQAFNNGVLRGEYWDLAAPAAATNDITVTIRAQGGAFSAPVCVQAEAWENVDPTLPIRAVMQTSGGSGSTTATVDVVNGHPDDHITDMLLVNRALDGMGYSNAAADALQKNQQNVELVGEDTTAWNDDLHVGWSTKEAAGGIWTRWTWDVAGNCLLMAASMVRVGSQELWNDATTNYVSKAGDDAGAGTYADPYLTIQTGLSALGGNMVRTVIKDSEVYNEKLAINVNLNSAGGLYALSGQTPIVQYSRGATPDTYGARLTGRTKFSTGAYPATFYFVSKAGNDGTGARGNINLPFLTWQAAINDGARIAGDTIRCLDSGIYVEDIVIAAGHLTMEALDGQTPVIQGVAVAAMINSTNINLAIYGITFMDDRSPTIGDRTIQWADGGAGNLTLDVYDCSFYGGWDGIVPVAPTAGTDTVNVINCHFFRQYGSAVSLDEVDVALNIRNCMFEQIGMQLETENGVIFVDNHLASGTAANFIDIEDSTFLNILNSTCVGIRDDQSGTETVIDRCLFKNEAEWQYATNGVYGSTTGLGNLMVVRDCHFDNLGGCAFLWVGYATGLPPGGGIQFQSCVAESCGAKAAPATSANFCVYGGTAGGPGTNFIDCVSVNAARSGFWFRDLTLASTTTYQNCAVINAGRDAASAGFYVEENGAGPAGDLYLYYCSEKGSSGTYGLEFVSGLGTINVYTYYTVFDTGYGGTGTILDRTGTLTADPLFVSDVIGYENAALSSLSPAVNRWQGDVSSTAREPLAVLTATNQDFTIAGIQFQGDVNFLSGLYIQPGQLKTITVEDCTFVGLGAQALQLRSPTTVQRCLFRSTNGVAIMITYPGSTVQRCVGVNCAAAFIHMAIPMGTVEHCTAYGCEFGQYDETVGTAFRLRNNVFAGSGVEDYFGHDVQHYSCIPRLSTHATISNGSRRDPLFRDVTTPDLRLQAVEFGYSFDSPAKGLAEDGSDAGAYEIEYGGEMDADGVFGQKVLWTEIDFATGAGDPLTAYRNPDWYERESVPVKLVEVEKHDGSFVSTAQAFVRQHRFRWNKANVMPLAQVLALRAIYETGTGECQLSFDEGVSWTPVRVVRSKEFRYTEIKGAYFSDNSLPTPVAEILFRESS